MVVEEVEPAGGEDVEPMGMGAFSPCLTVFFEARFRGWVSFLRGLRFVVSISTGRPCWSTTHPRLMNVACAGAAFAFFLLNIAILTRASGTSVVEGEVDGR